MIDKQESNSGAHGGAESNYGIEYEYIPEKEHKGLNNILIIAGILLVVGAMYLAYQNAQYRREGVRS